MSLRNRLIRLPILGSGGRRRSEKNWKQRSLRVARRTCCRSVEVARRFDHSVVGYQRSETHLWLPGLNAS